MRFLTRLRSRLVRNGPLESVAERQLLLQARAFALVNRQRHELSGLHEAEFRVFSQWGEDGILDWIISRLPRIAASFVEFGVEDYREANSRLLLHLRNWRGLVIDGSADNIAAVRAEDYSWRYDLTARAAFVTRDNINGLIADAGFRGEIGVLSVDIDGNDYWVWQAIEVVSPAVVVCEYNAVLGDLMELSVPYVEEFQRTQAHHSNLYFGASIRALVSLATVKGYVFVGTNSNGCNAFFVRGDLADTVVNDLECRWIFPSKFREARAEDGSLLYLSGAGRREVIRDLPVIDFARNQVVPLGELPKLYSSAWASGEAVRHGEVE